MRMKCSFLSITLVYIQPSSINPHWYWMYGYTCMIIILSQCDVNTEYTIIMVGIHISFCGYSPGYQENHQWWYEEKKFSTTGSLCKYITSLTVRHYVVFVTGLSGVHEMHGRVHPNLARYNYLVLCCRPSPLAYPTDSTTLLVTSYLPIKTLVAR